MVSASGTGEIAGILRDQPQQRLRLPFAVRVANLPAQTGRFGSILFSRRKIATQAGHQTQTAERLACVEGIVQRLKDRAGTVESLRSGLQFQMRQMKITQIEFTLPDAGLKTHIGAQRQSLLQ